MIFYFCPDLTLKSAGMRILYRHVEILVRHGFPAAILHGHPSFRLSDMPAVPVRYLLAPGTVTAGDVVVIPEGFPDVMEMLKGEPVRKIVIALNWRYIYWVLPDGMDWRRFGIERVLTHSGFIGDFTAWAMGLPAHVFGWGIRPELYAEGREKKRAQVAYLSRKQGELSELKRVLWSRNPELVERIAWKGLDGLSESDYAREICGSRVFLNMSPAEGLPCSLLEAMRSGAVVAGFNSVGGQRELVGAGEKQNCLLAENLDYVTLARILEPLLKDLLVGDMARWERIRQNGIASSLPYTPEAEEASVMALWRSLLK